MHFRYSVLLLKLYIGSPCDFNSCLVPPKPHSHINQILIVYIHQLGDVHTILQIIRESKSLRDFLSKIFQVHLSGKVNFHQDKVVLELR